MRRLSRNLTAFCCGIAFVGVLAVSMGQTTGGFPSRPRFQSVGVNAPAPALAGDLFAQKTAAGAMTWRIHQDSNDATNQSRLSILSGDASGQLIAAGSGRTSAVLGSGGPSGAQVVLRSFASYPLLLATNNTLAATISAAQVADFVNTPTVAGVAIFESGTFIASFVTACTTTPTITFDYQRVGNIVSLSPVATTGFPCTGDSTSFLASSALPASIRPLAGGGSGLNGPIMAGFLDNAVARWALLSVEVDGDIAIANCATFGANCSNVGWTASGNRNVGILSTLTYMLGNP